MWKVMIADDEPYIREGMEKLIPWRELGCELVCSVSNGQEALDYFKEQLPDIIILDIKMPLVSGLEVAAYITEQNLDIRVILLTAYTDFQYAHTAIKLGVCDYIVKTFALEEVPEAVRKITKELEARQKKRCWLVQIEGDQKEKVPDKILDSTFQTFESRRLSEEEDGFSLLLFTEGENGRQDIENKCEYLRSMCKNFMGIRVVTRIYGEFGEEQEALDFREYMEAERAGQEEQPETQGQEDLFHLLKLYIEENFTKHVTLNDIAEALHANRSYISRLYKQKTGENLFDAINARRVEQAKEQIRSGTRKIYEIAREAGYDDTAYFSRVFKKYTGMSPRDYERQCRNGEIK